MKRWRILTIGPTDVYLHPALLVCVLYAWITGHLLFLMLATASIMVHEVSHAAVSALFGQSPTSIEITPLGAVMHLEDDIKLSPLKRAIMLLAGPIATILLCYASIWTTRAGLTSHLLGNTLFMCNLSILLLNLLPVFPLDGGRLLALILGLAIPQNLVGKIMRCVGMTVGVVLVLLNIIASWQFGGWNLSLALTGCCIIYSSVMSVTTRAMAELRYFLDRKIALEQKKICRTAWYTSLHTCSLVQLIRMLPPGRFAMFNCIEMGSMQPMGCLTEYEVIQCYMNHPTMTLAEGLQWKENRTALPNVSQSEQ